MSDKFAPGKARPGRKIKRKHKRGHVGKKSPGRRRAKVRTDRDGNGFSDLAEVEANHVVKRRMGSLKQYLARTELEKVVSKSLKLLIEKEKLPKNPYSFLIPSIREKEFDMQVLGLKGILHKNTTLPTKRDHGFITQVKDNFEAFGIANVMQRIDPHVVGQLMEKMWNIDGMWATFSEGDYGHKSGRIEVLTSLVGPSTFFGSILPYLSNLRLSHDIIVTCKKMNDGMKTFSNFIVQNYADFRYSNQGITQGITVVQKSRSGGKGTPKVWPMINIKNRRAEFNRQVIDSVRAKQPIYMDCIVWLPIKPGKMVHGSGHFKVKHKKGSIKTKTNADGEQEEVFSSDEEGENGEADESDHEGGYYRVRKEYTMHYFSKENAAKAQSFCMHPYASLSMGVYRSKDDAKRYAEIHGMPDPDLDKHLYDLPKQSLVSTLIEHFEDTDWIEACECLMCLCVLDRKESQLPLLAQLFSSICGQLRQMAVELHALADALAVIVKHTGLPENQLEQMERNIQFQFKTFFRKHANLVGGGGLGKSSTFAALKLSIRSKVDSLLNVYTRQLLVEDRSVRILHMVSRLYHVGELSIAADAMQVFVTVFALLNRYASKGKSARPSPDKLELPTASFLDLGKETERVIKTNRFPSKVARQSVVLQYFTDSHLDIAMNEVYQYLLAEPLYPNPYPHVTKILQGAWARNELWTQSDDAIEDELLLQTPHKPTERTDPKAPSCYVETCASGEAERIYGNRIALTLADPFVLDQLYDEIPEIHNNTDAQQHLKNNTEHICTAIARDCCIESRISQKITNNLPPFLEVHEHYCVEGNDKRSAVRLFIEHIMMYAKYFHDGTPHIMYGLGIGGIADENEFGNKLFNFDILQVKKNFNKVRMALKKATLDGSGICMHGIVKLKKPFPANKFLYLRKWFILHWRNGASKKNEVEFCSHYIPQAVYEEVYFDQKVCEISMESQLKTVHHGRAYQDPMDPTCQQYKDYAKLTREDVAVNWKHGNILEAYHALVPYCLMHQDDLEVLLDVTRMLRSPAQLIEYAKYESLVLQTLIYEFASADPEKGIKEKATSMNIKRQVDSHRTWLLHALNGLGDVFVKGAQQDINAKLSIVKRLVGTTDPLKRDEAIEMLQECTTYLYGVSACIADSVHANCPHIKEVIDLCVAEYEESKHVKSDGSVGIGLEHIENPDDSDDDL